MPLEAGEIDSTAVSSASIAHLSVEEAVALLDYAMGDNALADLEGVPLLFTEDLRSTQAFSCSKPTVFVVEEDEDYQLLPQAPHRLLSKQIRALRPQVWQNLQRMASADAKAGEEAAFQRRA